MNKSKIHSHTFFFLRRLALSLLCVIGSWLATASDWTVAQLMQALSSHRSGRATFTETTYLAMLKRPLQSSGELTFTAPDYLQKTTLLPKREILTLQGDKISIERKARTHVLPLADYPQIAAFIDSIRGTLVGDHAALTKTYELTLSGIEDDWQLLLIPKIAEAAGVRQIRIGGKAGTVNNIEIVQADGDRSVMYIENQQLDVSAPIEPAP